MPDIGHNKCRSHFCQVQNNPTLRLGFGAAIFLMVSVCRIVGALFPMNSKSTRPARLFFQFVFHFRWCSNTQLIVVVCGSFPSYFSPQKAEHLVKSLLAYHDAAGDVASLE